MTVAIEAEGLQKAYGDVAVLGGVDLTVDQGAVYSLLGPNGAGKTTMVRILATLTRFDAGTARVAGFDVVREPHRVRRSISLTGQHAAVDDLQTGAENLVMVGRLAGLPRGAAKARAASLVEHFDLTEAAHRRVATYSGGMRRRLDLAASLVVAPAVLFLDEPTTGLDPRSRQATWRAVAELARSGVTVLLTTQYLEEADRLADRIAVIDGGRIVAEGSPAELKGSLGGHRLELTLADDEAYQAVANRLGERPTRLDPAERAISVPINGDAAQVRGLLDELDPQRSLVSRFAIHTAALDDVFLSLTGRNTTSDDREPAHV